MEDWSYGVLGFTNTPILHHSITPNEIYFLIHGGIWIFAGGRSLGEDGYTFSVLPLNPATQDTRLRIIAVDHLVVLIEPEGSANHRKIGLSQGGDKSLFVNGARSLNGIFKNKHGFISAHAAGAAGRHPPLFLEAVIELHVKGRHVAGNIACFRESNDRVSAFAVRGLPETWIFSGTNETDG